jgi:signal transduction histidine kinase
VIAREAEAARIAREMHDELGQILTGIKLGLAGLCKKCGFSGRKAPEATSAPEANIAELSSHVDHAVDCVRRVSSDLRPAVLDRLGLAAALEGQVREFEARTGLAVVLEIDGIEEPLDGLVSITLFRIVQEALTNVARHAGASEVWVELRSLGGDITLVVRDDGNGMDPAAAEAARSLGIVGMRERALLAGGRLEIAGDRGRGTTIRVTIPQRS